MTILAVLLVCASTAAPAEAAQRRATSVGGWSTSTASVSPGAGVGTGIRVRSGGRAGVRRVALQHRRWGGSWRVLNRRWTRQDGRVFVRGVPPSSSQLRAVVRPTPRAQGRVTAARNVRVTSHRRRARRLPSEVLSRVNRLRRSGTRCAGTWHGPVRALRHNGRLASASRTYARRMAVHGFFGHTDGVTGKGPGWRATNAGYRWSVVGENVAAGYATPKAVLAAWRKSPGHCRNMMDRRWRHLGVGWYHGGRDSTWGNYWGQLFGKPR